MSEIIGINSILEKSVVIDEIKVNEMTVLHFLKYMNEEYNLDTEEKLDNIINVIDLVYDCTGVKMELTDDNVEELLLYYHAILNFLIPDSKSKESDYTYTLDYSFFIAKVIKWYSYNLEDVYKLPYSVFNTLLNHISVLEAEEDFRMSKVVDNQLNLRSDTTKGNYTAFKNDLSNKIKSVIDFNITEKANIKNWRKFHGIQDIKKAVEGGEE